MTAYDRVCELLREVGAVLVWSTDASAGHVSQWRLNDDDLILSRQPDSTLRLFRTAAVESRGRCDTIMDAVADLALSHGSVRIAQAPAGGHAAPVRAG